MPSLRKRIDGLLDHRMPAVPVTDYAVAERLRLVGLHGDFSLAYSTAVQDSLSRFGDSAGYIAFASKMGRIFALADPVAAHEDRADYLRRFVAAAGDPVFAQIGRDTADTLAGLGYRINQIGVDTRLTLATHDFSGKRNETVRYSERWLFNKGYSIVEDAAGAVSSDHAAALSAQWLAQRIVKKREMEFLNRPFRDQPGEGMRRFVLLDPGQNPVALLDFDPISSGGKAIGYTTSFKRKLPATTSHAEIGMTKFAVDRFRKDGLDTVTLGLSPMAGVAPSGYAESRLLRTVFTRAFRSGLVNRRIFNLEGQAAFKRRFHGAEEPVYIAFRKGSLFELIGLLRLCKAI